MQKSEKLNRFFEIEQDVKLIHQDTFGFILSYIFLKWIDECIEQHDIALGLDQKFFDKIQHKMVMIEQQFFLPKTVKNVKHVKIRTCVLHVESLYIVRETTIYDDINNLLCSSKAKGICLDLKTLKSKRLTPTFVMAYE